eukprot:TRINITY_DN145_c0_g2_i1.p1 TRINITY_DN145_c0_g2~~TRINITY_DN145_c0_g2_i1.p1  ORF type:complete len:260 (-),score=113.91 TRINITY_DN145_c0_g2_i1:169-948(-)
MACSLTSNLIQPFKYLIVIDYEATCDENRGFGPQEIIEFPAILIDTNEKKIISEFHSYCKPIRNPILTDFCKQLTGIQQHQVENAPIFNEVFESFEKWLIELGLLDPQQSSQQSSQQFEFAIIHCGDWDSRTMMPLQLSLTNIPTPSYFNRWINVKKHYSNFTSKPPTGMVGMLNQLKLPLVGRHHSGIDDSRNITAIVIHLLSNGVCFDITTTANPNPRNRNRNRNQNDSNSNSNSNPNSNPRNRNRNNNTNNNTNNY